MKQIMPTQIHIWINHQSNLDADTIVIENVGIDKNIYTALKLSEKNVSHKERCIRQTTEGREGGREIETLNLEQLYFKHLDLLIFTE